LFKLPNPPVKSVWIDNVLDITMIVQSIDKAKSEALVTCRHNQREWSDAMPLECFITELKEVK
jgi:hypothetical protein